MVCLFCVALAQWKWLAADLIVWQWHNGMQILFVAVAQCVAVAQWLADFVCSSGTMAC
jgi:hypothetical protein